MAIYKTAPPIVTSGLVLHLDAGNPKSYTSGSTVWNDLSGLNNSGSLVNGPTFSSINQGTIVFDGTNDYVIHPTLDLGTTCSWNVWINYTRASVGSEAFVVLGSNSPDRYTFYYDFQGRRFYVYYGSGALNSLTYNDISANTWYNVTHVRNGSTITIYVNGNPIGTITSSAVLSSIFALIGAERSAPFFVTAARIANVSYYNRILTPAEVAQNYNALKSRFGY